MTLRQVAGLLTCLVVLPATRAQFDSGSTGSDGAFDPLPGSNVVVDLALAGTGPGHGTYDPQRAAVIFNYTTVNVPSGVSVTFLNHPKVAPVVWLATGDVTIRGVISVNGARGSFGPRNAEPGPGGFAGGLGKGPLGEPPSSGLGPGGAGIDNNANGVGGSYSLVGGLGECGDAGAAGAVYGNPSILPLIGGSGGSGGWTVQAGGGAGGGAILIASSTRIQLIGASVRADGGEGVALSQPFGGGGGSGGSIRLMAPVISGTGSLSAQGGAGGFGSSCDAGAGSPGRIRVEAYDVQLPQVGTPAFSTCTPTLIWPPPAAPTLRVIQINGQPVTDDPGNGPWSPDAWSVGFVPVPVVVEATNVPPGTHVSLRLVGDRGEHQIIDLGPLIGTLESSMLQADVTFPECRAEMHLRANWTP